MFVSFDSDCGTGSDDLFRTSEFTSIKTKYQGNVLWKEFAIEI
jgi:hypothetical protein